MLAVIVLIQPGDYDPRGGGGVDKPVSAQVDADMRRFGGADPEKHQIPRAGIPGIDRFAYRVQAPGIPGQRYIQISTEHATYETGAVPAFRRDPAADGRGTFGDRRYLFL